jgi:hypothetical protein
LAASSAFGEDVGAVAAALKDEASECRYFQGLCSKAIAAKSEADITSLKMKARTEAGIHSRDEIDEADRLVNEGLRVFGQSAAAGRDVTTAREVIRAKHDKPPHCLESCSPLP